MPVFSGRVIKLTRALHELGNRAEAIGHALKDMAVSIASDETGRILAELHKATERDTNGHASIDESKT
jgi:hypothetical protein